LQSCIITYSTIPFFCKHTVASAITLIIGLYSDIINTTRESVENGSRDCMIFVGLGRLSNFPAIWRDFTRIMNWCISYFDYIQSRRKPIVNPNYLLQIIRPCTSDTFSHILQYVCPSP
jgi:hypothetical protein